MIAPPDARGNGVGGVLMTLYSVARNVTLVAYITSIDSNKPFVHYLKEVVVSAMKVYRVFEKQDYSKHRCSSNKGNSRVFLSQNVSLDYY
jgi:hypothetical protein